MCAKDFVEGEGY